MSPFPRKQVFKLGLVQTAWNQFGRWPTRGLPARREAKSLLPQSPIPPPPATHTHTRARARAHLAQMR
jgi:hypothetical protein